MGKNKSKKSASKGTNDKGKGGTPAAAKDSGKTPSKPSFVDPVNLDDFGSESPDVSCSLGTNDTCSSGEKDKHDDSAGFDSSKPHSNAAGDSDAHQPFDKMPEPNPSMKGPDLKAKPTWAEKIINSRRLEEGFTLKKVAFEDKVFDLDPSELVDVKQTWGHCLIGCFAGNYPGHNALRELCKGWKVPSKFFKHNSGWIVFQFECEVDRDAVFASGPYFAYGRPLILKSMPRCFQIDKAQDLNLVPVWIKLPGLPPDMWSESILSKIGSRVGTPMYTDSLTRTRKQYNYARMLVEIDASKELVNFVDMRLLNGETRKQFVEYEFVPKYCTDCKQLGHSLSGCEARKAALNAKYMGAKQPAAPKVGSGKDPVGPAATSQPSVDNNESGQPDIGVDKPVNRPPSSSTGKNATKSRPDPSTHKAAGPSNDDPLASRPSCNATGGAKNGFVPPQSKAAAPNKHIFFDDETDSGQQVEEEEAPFIEVASKKAPKKVSYVFAQKATGSFKKAAATYTKASASSNIPAKPKQKDKGRGDALPKSS